LLTNYPTLEQTSCREMKTTAGPFSTTFKSGQNAWF